jgi:hypothetical protein
MEAIKFVQSWNPVAGRKQEYAAFVTRELYPLMKALGLEVVSGWYTLIGGSSRVQFETLADSLDRVENALGDQCFHEMLGRFLNLVTHYATHVLQPAGWMTMYHWRVPCLQEIKVLQGWDVLRGQQEAHERFLREEYLPQMEEIGLGVTAGWHLLVGSGRQVLSESLAPNLACVAKALSDECYLRLILRMEDLVTHYESRVMIPHPSILDMLHNIHGRAIRAITPDALHSMVGPLDQ